MSDSQNWPLPCPMPEATLQGLEAVPGSLEDLSEALFQEVCLVEGTVQGHQLVEFVLVFLPEPLTAAQEHPLLGFEDLFFEGSDPLVAFFRPDVADGYDVYLAGKTW